MQNIQKTIESIKNPTQGKRVCSFFRETLGISKPKFTLGFTL